MAESRKGTWTFLISLFISFIILSIVFTLFFLYSKLQEADSSVDNVPVVEVYKPKRDESINVIFIGCNQLNAPPTLITMLTYDAPNGAVSITALPPSALATVGIKTDTLAKHYDYEGIRGGVNAVKNLLLTDVDRYVRIDKQGIANLVDYLGGLEYDLVESVTCGDELFSPGKQLLDGRRVASLLLNESVLEQSRTSLQRDLIKALISQRFTKPLVKKYDGFISAFFNNCETNLNQYDFAVRQKGLVQCFQNDSLLVNEISIAGSYNLSSTEFTPTSESLQSAIEAIEQVFAEVV